MKIKVDSLVEIRFVNYYEGEDTVGRFVKQVEGIITDITNMYICFTVTNNPLNYNWFEHRDMTLPWHRVHEIRMLVQNAEPQIHHLEIRDGK